MPLNLPLKGNAPLSEVVARIDRSLKLEALWAASNIVAIDRMHINDHGPVHVKIMTNIALKLLRLLAAGGVAASVVSDHSLRDEDAEVVVVLASVLHDVGHVIHRDDHEAFSLVLAAPVIDELLDGVYDERGLTILKGEALHAIYAHHRAVTPLTIEAGVVKVADALDMEAGRARIPFSMTEPTIHSVSALAIQKVKIGRGQERPIRISIQMSNSAGIFQVDNLLREKLKASTIAPHVEVVAEVVGEEKKIIERFSID
jgi:metal-dependent HD superfamily phosphatase/phosphodiesterase